MATTPFTLIDTNAVPWENNPGIPGFKRRLLAFDDAKRAEIRMDYVPPRTIPDVLQLPHRHYHNSVTERAYTLFGDVSLQMAENGSRHDLGLREGGFLLWRSGAALSVPQESATDGGCVALCVGHDLSEPGGR